MFEATFTSSANTEFMTRVVRYAERRKWTHLLHAFRAGVERVAKLMAADEEEADVDADADAATAAAAPAAVGTDIHCSPRHATQSATKSALILES